MVEDGHLAEHVVLVARRVQAVQVAEQPDDPGLVDRQPPAHAVAVRVEARRRVLGEALDRVAVAPAAVVLERLRQVPVVERHHGLDAALEQRVEQPLVVVEAAPFSGARPVGKSRGQAIEKR